MASVQANGITIEYESVGSGEPLLLVMGLGGQLIDWPQGFPEQLAHQGFRVITFDNRDVGLSTEFDWEPPSQAKAVLGKLARRPPKAGYLISDMADDAAGLLDALNIEAAHLVGISMGGMISQTMAIHHPTKVLSLTSIMSNTGARNSGGIAAKLMPKLARLPTPTRDTAVDSSVKLFELFTGPHFDEEEHRRVGKIGLERSFRPDGTARQLAAIAASPDRTSALSEIKVPTLVIHGLVDTLVVSSGGIATAKAVQGARLLMYPDMGHDLPVTRHGEIVDAIRRNADRAGDPKP
jgi:pimeloyl-ACP methyl ester carboxylesterase